MKKGRGFTLKRGLIWGMLPLGVALILLLLFFVLLPRRLPPDAIVVPRDFPTIQAALDKASPGTAIFVQAGEGPFTGPLTIKTAGISLFSKGGKASLQYEGQTAAITLSSQNVKIDGFVITTTGCGIRLENAYECMVENIAIRNAAVGVKLSNSRSNELHDISIDEGKVGIEMALSGDNHLATIHMQGLTGPGISLMGSWSNLIENVSILNGQVGISLKDGSTENKILSCRLDGFVDGIVISDSRNNIIAETGLDKGETGISLDKATGNEIRDNQISRCAVTGVGLQESALNKLLNNKFNGATPVGVTVSKGNENALMYNTINDCMESGISLADTDKNLVLGNRLQRNGIGLYMLGAKDNLLLHNTVRESVRIGILVSGGKENLLLANRITAGPFGIALVKTNDNHLANNEVMDCVQAGLSLNTSRGNVTSGNDFTRNSTGIIIIASSRTAVTENSVSKNDIGLRLFLAGEGTRIEGNLITDNAVGIEIDPELDWAEPPLVVTEEKLNREAENNISPVITSNNFRGNSRYDIWNKTGCPIYVGKNSWNGSQATEEKQGNVSAGVILSELATRAIIGVGTNAQLDQVILGQLVRSYLQENGFRVVDLIGLRDKKRLGTALAQGDIELIWVAPRAIEPIQTGSSEYVTLSTIKMKRFVVVASGEIAAALPRPTVSALSLLIQEGSEPVTIAASKTLTDEELGGFLSAYSMPFIMDNVVRTQALAETESILKLGNAQVGIVNGIQETLSSTGFEVLEDDLGFFRTGELALVARRNLLLTHPEVEPLLENLTSLLTEGSIHRLAIRARLLHEDPTTVAEGFLTEQGLIPR
ncbi:MAG: NosD domain-containing protein [Candidatus Bipolaricaulota bacterium]|nr:NosD domain-containing protein [Candidatus Bipolaricaulota bacterium]